MIARLDPNGLLLPTAGGMKLEFMASTIDDRGQTMERYSMVFRLRDAVSSLLNHTV
ncbi:MAG: hypothetical protein JSR31_13940 [Nitrospira sp.]|nr:hypothetical protein [Nitrospira sp.]